MNVARSDLYGGLCHVSLFGDCDLNLRCPAEAPVPNQIVHLIIYVLLGAFVIGIIEGIFRDGKRARPKSRSREDYFPNTDGQARDWRKENFSYRDNHQRYWRENDLSNTDNQLRFVSDGDFSLKPIMSLEVYSHAFLIVERFINDLKRGYRVLPELCLGAVLWCRDDSAEHRAFKSINSKRVDIGIVDEHGKLVIAVEYQGAGHYQGNAEGRDAVKRLALSKVGVEIVEIFPEDDPEQIINKVAKALRLIDWSGKTSVSAAETSIGKLELADFGGGRDANLDSPLENALLSEGLSLRASFCFCPADCLLPQVLQKQEIGR